jgi:hypothetical protein
VLPCDYTSRGDGFGALRRDAVLALWGDNLFKFAPLLGALLSDAARAITLPDALSWFLPMTSTPRLSSVKDISWIALPSSIASHYT